MSKSYINVFKKSSNNLVHKYIEDGIRKTDIIRYQPILGYKVDEPTEWKDLFGNNIKTIRFDSMAEAGEWKKNNKSLFDIYGDINFEIAFIGENYPEDIIPQKNLMNIYNFDIEAFSLEVETAPEPIRSITFENLLTGILYVFAYKEEYISDNPKVRYYKCNDETHLLKTIINFFQRQDIDILTGWNTSGYDIGYLYNRCVSILGEDEAKKISPCGKVTNREKMVNKIPSVVYYIEGIVCWDYQTLYKKFTRENRESYSLNFISKLELGEEKTEYKDEYETLEVLYNKNFQKFITYNIRDCQLVHLLDDKLKYIDNAISYTYMGKVDPQNIFGTTKPWDSLLYCESLKEKMLCIPMIHAEKVNFGGGYVKEPNKGMRYYLTANDIISSYPNQIAGNNMSLETIVPKSEINKIPELKHIIDNFYGIEKCLDLDTLNTITPILQKYNLTYSSNGQFFRRDKQGFIPKIVMKIFKERIDIKKQIKKLKSDPEKNKELISILDNRQYTLKIFINSIYGAISCNHFRYFDIRIAEAVTWQGQVCARGAANFILNNHKNIVWDYGDTDSLYLNLEKVIHDRFGKNLPDLETIVKFMVKYQERVIEPTIKTFFDRYTTTLNLFQSSIEMENDGIFHKALFVEKKKYVASCVYSGGKYMLDKPKLKISGIEVVRTSTPLVVRKKIEEVLYLIFGESTNNDLIEFNSKFKTEFCSLPFEVVAMPRGVNFKGSRKDKQTGEVKQFEYELTSSGLPINVRAAYLFNKALKDYNLTKKYALIESNNKIKFAYIKTPNVFKSNVFGCLEKMPSELSSKFQIDYNTMFEKTYLSPLQKIFCAIGWKMEPNPLEDFF